LTSRGLVSVHLEAAGLDVRDVSEVFSYFADRSLVQRHHGSPPKVFHIEAVKDGERFEHERSRLR